MIFCDHEKNKTKKKEKKYLWRIGVSFLYDILGTGWDLIYTESCFLFHLMFVSCFVFKKLLIFWSIYFSFMSLCLAFFFFHVFFSARTYLNLWC